MEGTIKINENSACYLLDKPEEISLPLALIYACLRHIHDKGCTEISKEDRLRINDSAVFLVRSMQVNSVEDITLDSILECFNDTDIDRKYL